MLGSVLVTMAGVSFGLGNEGIRDAVMQHWFISFLLIMAPLMLAQSTKLAMPQRLGLVALFAGMEGVWLSPLIFAANVASPGIVGQAGGLTLGAFSVLTFYTFVSRRDFSAWGGFLITGLFVLMAALLIGMFFPLGQSAYLWMSAMGVLLFAGLLVFDTWRLLRSNQFGPDDFIPAAIQIYLDLLNMFLFILSMLGGGRRK
ncbi:MAG: Bax inhibitor-1 family protein [Gemmatimonadetes bacterium]|nr:Bax inhibitor-1 family protein [Gemmatimonadota bacterium]